MHVFIDGVETFDHTGLWQNYSMPDGDSIFFAWRWASRGLHVIRLAVNFSERAHGDFCGLIARAESEPETKMAALAVRCGKKS